MNDLNILFLSFGLNEKQKFVVSSMKSVFEMNGHAVNYLDFAYFEDGSVMSGHLSRPVISNSCAVKLFEDLQSEKYNLIICLDSVACKVACAVTKRCDFKTLVFMLQTDYSFHREYLSLDADAFFLTSGLFLDDYESKIDKEKLFTYLTPALIADNKPFLDFDYCVVFSDMLENDEVSALAEALSKICFTVVVAKADYRYIRDKLSCSKQIKVFPELCFDISNCKAVISTPYSIYSAVAVSKKLPLILMNHSSAYKPEELNCMEKLGLGIGCCGIKEAADALDAIMNDSMTLACIRLNLQKYHSSISCTDVCKTIMDFYNK